MAERLRDPRLVNEMLYEQTPSTHQTVKFLTAAIIGTILLILSALTLTGTVMALILATPLLVLFSPILVPATVVIFLAAIGFVLSGGCSVAGLSMLAWIYNYVAGKHPVGADQQDYGRMKLADTARDLKEKAKMYGQHVQYKAQDVTHGE